MQGIFQKENTDKALKYGIYRHLPTYEKIIRNLVSFYRKEEPKPLPFGNVLTKGTHAAVPEGKLRPLCTGGVQNPSW